MKRAAPEADSPWLQLCARLGVQPKQFAVLLAVAGAALVLLGGKWMLSGPRAASATPTPSEAAAPAPAPSAPAGEAPSGTPTSTATPSDAAPESQAIEVRLDTQPRRDPFRHFIERPTADGVNAALVGAPGDTPLDLSVFRLRATMDSEWAVINDQTLRIGDPIGIGPDGMLITLLEVGHRRAVVQWRGRTFELSFSHTAAGGTR